MQNGVVIFITFKSKIFRCIYAKRAGFEDLVMSKFATRFKRRQHIENITDDAEFPIQGPVVQKVDDAIHWIVISSRAVEKHKKQ